MENESIHLTIVSPEKTLFEGRVKYVKLPGSAGQFGVYDNHAPLISSLDKGDITFRHAAGKESIAVEGGFVEVNNNEVTACVTEAKV